MIKRAIVLSLASALSAGCAMKPGPKKGGIVVEAEGAGATQAKAESAAMRKAVDGLIEFYVAPEARARELAAIEERVLAKAGRFVKRKKIVARGKGAEQVALRLRAFVALPKLAKELDALGAVRPEGVAGSPKIVLSLRERGPGARKELGSASDALRRVLMERGYMAMDLSDPLNKEYLKDGDPNEALAIAKKMRADVLVTGTVSAEPVYDERLSGYRSFVAKAEIEASVVSTLREIGTFTKEANAVDVETGPAAAKALSNVGELLGDPLREALAEVFRARTEIALVVLGIGGPEKARAFLRALRAQPKVVGAALSAFAGGDAKLRVFVEKMAADELTAHLLKLRGYELHVRAVEPDFNYIELQSGNPAF